MDREVVNKKCSSQIFLSQTQYERKEERVSDLTPVSPPLDRLMWDPLVSCFLPRTEHPTGTPLLTDGEIYQIVVFENTL